MKKTPILINPGLEALTAGDGINPDSLNDDRVVELLLRSEDNLIKINEDGEMYVDLQLEDGIATTDDLPVGVTTGRVLVADGRPVAGTMLCFKTTSGDYVTWIYGDDGKLYIDNGTGTFKQIYTKPEIDALFQGLATVAHTGDYDDLINKPTLGTASALDVGTDPGDIPVIGPNGKLDGSIVPSVGVMNVYTVASLGDLTTLSQATQGDIGVVTNDNETYILSADPYSTLSNWVQLLFPTGAVSSVNGQTGAVTLTTNDIATANDKLYVSSAEKTAWNNKLDSNDVSAVALSGSFSDLTNKPIIDSTLDVSSTNAIQNGAVTTVINTIQSDLTALQTTTNGLVSDTAYGAGWDADTTHAPSKNAVYDKIESIVSDISDLGTNKQDTLVSGTNIKTINNESILGSGNLDLTSIVVTGASFGAFASAIVADGGTKHTSEIHRAWKQYDQNVGTETYTMQGLGRFTATLRSANDCQVYVEVNGLKIFEAKTSSGLVSTDAINSPITLSPGDTVSVTCIQGDGYGGELSAYISDFY